MQKEKLSALMDGETLDSELLGTLSKDKALQQSWQSYHLIRDTLRGDVGNVLHMDIASRVAEALKNEPARLIPIAIPESQPQPHLWQKMPFWQKSVRGPVRLLRWEWPLVFLSLSLLVFNNITNRHKIIYNLNHRRLIPCQWWVKHHPSVLVSLLMVLWY